MKTFSEYHLDNATNMRYHHNTYSWHQTSNLLQSAYPTLNMQSNQFSLFFNIW